MNCRATAKKLRNGWFCNGVSISLPVAFIFLLSFSFPDFCINSAYRKHSRILSISWKKSGSSVFLIRLGIQYVSACLLWLGNHFRTQSSRASSPLTQPVSIREPAAARPSRRLPSSQVSWETWSWASPRPSPACSLWVCCFQVRGAWSWCQVSIVCVWKPRLRYRNTSLRESGSFYLFKGRGEGQREAQGKWKREGRENHCSSSSNSQGWAKPKPGACKSIWASHMCGRVPGTWASLCCFQRHINRKLD